MNKLTIVLPIKEEKQTKEYLLSLHPELHVGYEVVTIDNDEGQCNLPDARRYGIDRSNTDYTLCLDLDTILPKGYIDKAIEILDNNPQVAVVALDYEELQGHLAFGTSIWRTKILQDLYDWKGWTNERPICECIWMWMKVHNIKMKIETINGMRAKHIGHEGDNRS